MTVYTIIGLAGFAGYVASYALLQVGMLDGNGVIYTLANMAAASMVLISLFERFNLASLLTQVFWIGFGLVGLVRRLRSRSPRAERLSTALLCGDGDSRVEAAGTAI